MNRRSFFNTIAAAMSLAVMDPERLLWVPGQKTIFIPPMVERLPNLDMINAMTLKYIRDTGLVENIFKMNPMLAACIRKR